MSPPIYTPDGSEVSEIVLPDGSTASEVIGPDGNIVFEAGPDIPDSGVARYRFENSVQDSWNNYDGVDNTGLGYTSSSQDGSASKLFDTSNAGVDISTAPSNQSFTFVGYIYFENDVSDKQHFGANSVGNGDSVLMRITGIGGSWRFEVAGTQLDFSSNNIQTDSWIHIGFGYDASTGTGTVYEDGSILDNKSYNEGSLSSITDGLSLGAFGVGDTIEPLDGRLDDVRYYSKRLSGTEYSNLYNTGSIDG